MNRLYFTVKQSSTMSSAYVLIMCELGCEIAVMDEIRALSQVTEVNRVCGSS